MSTYFLITIDADELTFTRFVNHFGQFGFGIPLAITSCTLQLPLPITVGTFLYQSLSRIIGAE